MAQKITVTLEDDLDGGPADETVRFGLDGAGYEVDLSKKNATALRKQLAPFIEHARKAGRAQRRRPGRTASAESAAAISGPGRKTTASRSAAAGASPRMSLSSTKPPKAPDSHWHGAGLNDSSRWSGPAPLTASSGMQQVSLLPP